MKDFECPLVELDCPYYNRNFGTCNMTKEGLNPTEECDTAGFYADNVEAQEQFYNAFYG